MIVRGGAAVAPRDGSFKVADPQLHFLKATRKAGEELPAEIKIGRPDDQQTFGPTLQFEIGDLKAGDAAPIDGVYYLMPDGPEEARKAGETFPDADPGTPGMQGDYVWVRELSAAGAREDE